MNSEIIDLPGEVRGFSPDDLLREEACADDNQPTRVIFISLDDRRRLNDIHKQHGLKSFEVIVSSMSIFRHGETPFKHFEALVEDGLLMRCGERYLPEARGKSPDGGAWPPGLARSYKLTRQGKVALG